jgi:predicted RNA-binding protein Jag
MSREKETHFLFLFSILLYKIVTIVRDVIFMYVKVITIVKKRKTNLIHFTNQSMRRRLKNKMKINMDLPMKKKEKRIHDHLSPFFFY